MRSRTKNTPLPPEPTDVDIVGPNTNRWILTVEDFPALAAHRIAHMGFCETVAPYRRVRHHPGGSYLVAVCQGSARFFLDGDWREVSAGTVCLAPPRVLNAYEACAGEPLAYFWIRYNEPLTVRPLVTAASPLGMRFAVNEFRRVVEGLRSEWEGVREIRPMQLWMELAHSLARRVAQPWQVNAKLWGLWEDVGTRLDHHWDLGELADRFHTSKEHLRRICLRELGRTPMDQLTYMRMQLAQKLLDSTHDKLEVVAKSVGYENAHVFSRAFKRWIGSTPSDYRKAHGSTAPH